MSKGNPDRAIAALLPEAIAIPGTDLQVRPITLATYALLERVRSPFLVSAEDGAGPGVQDLLPTLYIVTHTAAEAAHGDIQAKALAWADELPPTVLPLIKAATLQQVAVMLDVIPEPSSKGKKKRPR